MSHLPLPTSNSLRTFATALGLAGLAACVGNFPGSGTAAGANGSTASTSSTTTLGPTSMRRLSRSEYNNTVHDLLGTSQTPADSFPVDPVSDGFDNNGVAQVLSLANLDAYFTAAGQLAAEAIGTSNLPVVAPCPTGQSNQTCLTNFVQTFGLRAWRRPLTSDEVNQTLTLAAGAGTDYAPQVQVALTALLSSPNFIFLVEIDPPGSTAVHKVSGYELATRLSYFLWSSTPDSTLLAAAADGSVLTDTGLRAQVTRMLADSRSSALSTDFASQWMQMPYVATFKPDPNSFPTWDSNLQTSMISQTQMTLDDLLHGQTPLSGLFDGNTTYLNDRLAKHYGLPAVGSTTLVKTAVPPARRGLLAQAAILTNSSFPLRTSLVRRGEFILDQILCATIPPPPPNVPALPSSTTPTGSQRTLLLQHASTPTCASCHTMLDPYGFVLESYDAIGASRTTDNGFAIDTNSTLPNGVNVSNVTDLQASLKADSRLSSCAVQKVFEYSLGRSITADDATTVTQLVQNFTANGQMFNQLIVDLIVSDAFQMRRSN